MTLYKTRLFQGTPEYVPKHPVSIFSVMKTLLSILFLFSANAFAKPNVIVFLIDDLGWADLSLSLIHI